MLEAGKQASADISLSNIGVVSERLMRNMAKAEADGQTALTPALTFCLGLTQAWKHDLNQM